MTETYRKTNASRRIARLLASLFLALIFWAGAQDQQAAEQSPDTVVLRAGDYEETLGEFEERFEIAIRGLAASQGLELTDEIRTQLAEFRPSFLEQRATEVALLQEAERRGIEVTEAETDELVEEARSSVPEGQEFASILEEAGFRDETQLRQLVNETERIQRVVDQIEADIEVGDEAVQAFYEENQEQFAQPEQVCARHILVETEEAANDIKSQLEGGGDFAALADEHSIDTGTSGGDLGCFGRGRMVPPFEQAAFDATVGEPTGPVESQFGQHLILVYEKREAQTVPLEQVRPQIEAQLRRSELQGAIEELRQQAAIETHPEVVAPTAEGEQE